MPSVGVIFEIRRAETLPGEVVRVCGNREELGRWEPSEDAESAEADVLRLRTGALSYPRWLTLSPLWIKYEDHAKDEGSPQLLRIDTATTTVDSLDEVALEYTHEAERSTPSRSLSEASTAPSSPGEAPATGLSVQTVPVPLDADEPRVKGAAPIKVEYKFVKDFRQIAKADETGLRWEDKIKNRSVLLPREPGSLWLISDMCWNKDGKPKVTRISEEDVLWQSEELDPDYSAGRSRACSKLSQSVDIAHISHISQSMDAGCLHSMDPGCVHSLTPGCETPPGDAAYDIEDEFDALANRRLPELLTERLVAMQSASDMSAELLELRRENALVGAERDQLQEEVDVLRDEVLQSRQAMTMMIDVAERLDNASRVRLGEVSNLHAQNEGLRGENMQLLAQLEELRLQLSNTRASIIASEDCIADSKGEVEVLRVENSDLKQECEELRPVLPELQSQLMEAQENLDALEEEAAELAFYHAYVSVGGPPAPEPEAVGRETATGEPRELAVDA